jgi:hypothetical protein
VVRRPGAVVTTVGIHWRLGRHVVRPGLRRTLGEGRAVAVRLAVTVAAIAQGVGLLVTLSGIRIPHHPGPRQVHASPALELILVLAALALFLPLLVLNRAAAHDRPEDSRQPGQSATPPA